MAYATVTFNNPNTGAIKEAPVGFSWTTFFFSFFPALFRGHTAGAIIQFLAALCTLGFSGYVFCFIYNKMYIRYLIGEGFKASGATQDIGDISARLGVQIPTAEA